MLVPQIVLLKKEKLYYSMKEASLIVGVPISTIRHWQNRVIPYNIGYSDFGFKNCKVSFAELQLLYLVATYRGFEKKTTKKLIAFVRNIELLSFEDFMRYARLNLSFTQDILQTTINMIEVQILKTQKEQKR